jgi:hypothetical protein
MAVMTSVLNTNDTEVDMQETLVELDKAGPPWDRFAVLSSNLRTKREILTRTFKYRRKKAIGSSMLRLPCHTLLS